MKSSLCQALYSLKGLHSKKVPCSRHYKAVKWCNLFRTQDLKTNHNLFSSTVIPTQAKEGSALSGLRAKYDFYAFKLAKSRGICYPRGHVESLIMYFLDGDKSKSLSALYFRSLSNFQHENLHFRYQQNNRLEYQIIIRFWETAHLPLP